MTFSAPTVQGPVAMKGLWNQVASSFISCASRGSAASSCKLYGKQLRIEGRPQMKTETASTLRFYKNSHLHSLLGTTAVHTVFRHQDQPLAEQYREAGPVRVNLLATSSQGTVSGAQAGQDVPSFDYTAYGHSSSDDATVLITGFNGEAKDLPTDGYLLGNGYRAFNPRVMRFSSSDSESPFGDGGLNAYMYCAGDPVNRADPSGRSPWRPRPLNRAVFNNGLEKPGPATYRSNTGYVYIISHGNPLPRNLQSQIASGAAEMLNPTPAPLDLSIRTDTLDNFPFYSSLKSKITDGIRKGHHQRTQEPGTPAAQRHSDFVVYSGTMIVNRARRVGMQQSLAEYDRNWPQVTDTRTRERIGKFTLSLYKKTLNIRRPLRQPISQSTSLYPNFR